MALLWLTSHDDQFKAQWLINFRTWIWDLGSESGFSVSGIIIEYFCLTWHCEQQTLRHVFLLFNCFFVIKLIQFARICKWRHSITFSHSFVSFVCALVYFLSFALIAKIIKKSRRLSLTSAFDELRLVPFL